MMRRDGLYRNLCKALGVLLLGSFVFMLVPPSSFASEKIQETHAHPLGLTLDCANAEGLFYVLGVLPGSPGARAGVCEGDFIVPPRENLFTSQEVIDYLNSRLLQGFSVFLKGERKGVPQLYWVRPYRFTPVQEEAVRFSLALQKEMLQGRTLWREGVEAFNTYLYRALPSEELIARISTIRKELFDCSRRLLREDPRKPLCHEMIMLCRSAQDGYARAIEVRRRALLELASVADHEGETWKLHRLRREEAEKEALFALHIEAQAGKSLLYVLRRSALREEDIPLLGWSEKGHRDRLSLVSGVDFPDVFSVPPEDLLSEEAFSPDMRRKYAFLSRQNRTFPADRMAYWAGENLLVLWNGDVPRYLFLWNGAMWYQIALKRGEPLGKALQRNRETLRQQKGQNGFEVLPGDLEYVTFVGSREKLYWMGVLAW